MTNSQSGSAKKGNDSIPALEWIVAAVGVVILVATLGFLFREAASGDKSPPDIVVQVDSISASPEARGFLVEFRAVNRGGTTAATVGIAAELTDNGSTIESQGTQLDYLPAHSTRVGGLFFSHDPRQFKLTLRSSGYQKP